MKSGQREQPKGGGGRLIQFSKVKQGEPSERREGQRSEQKSPVHGPPLRDLEYPTTHTHRMVKST